MRSHTITADDDGRTLTVSPGDELEILLPENAGTGYLWQLDSVAPPLRVVEETTKPALGMAGAAGAHRFVLRAERPGETAIVARHARPWESAGEVRRFRVTVRIPEER